MRTDSQETIADWLIRFSGGSRAQYRHSIDQYTDWLDDLDPLDVTRATVQRYVAHLVDRGYADATVRAKVSAVASFYKYALQEKLIDTNPAADLKRPLGEGEVKRGLPPDKARKMIAAARRHSPTAHALVWMMAGVGLRVAEACSARVEDLDVDEQLLTVTVKRGHRKTKPITDEVLAAIDTMIAGRIEGTILTNRDGNRLTRHRAWELVEKVAAEAGIEHCSPHVLRHTAATLALEAGAPVQDVKELLGHRSLETTLRYIHNRDILGGTRKAAELLASVLAD